MYYTNNNGNDFRYVTSEQRKAEVEADFFTQRERGRRKKRVTRAILGGIIGTILMNVIGAFVFRLGIGFVLSITTHGPSNGGYDFIVPWEMSVIVFLVGALSVLATMFASNHHPVKCFVWGLIGILGVSVVGTILVLCFA